MGGATWQKWRTSYKRQRQTSASTRVRKLLIFADGRSAHRLRGLMRAGIGMSSSEQVVALANQMGGVDEMVG